MISNDVIFYNPIITPGYYYAKIINLKTEESDFHFPKLLIYLKLHPDYNLANIILASIIHPTINSEIHFENFWKTYGVLGDGSYSDCRERYGSIQVYNAEYNGSEYSAVKYVYQPIPIRMKACRLTREEREEG